MAKKTINEPKTEKAGGDDDILATARSRFGAAVDAESDNRKNYVADVEFSISSDQWPEEIKRLRGKHRPALTINRLNGVIKQIIGDYRQHKLALKVLPASGDASEEMADILAGLMRNIEAQSNADMARTTALDCAVRGGFGYYRILTEYCGDDGFDQDIVYRPIQNPLTVYMDPAARLITREDANWCFIAEKMPMDEFKRRYPKAKTTASFDDSNSADWCSDDEMRVCEYYEKVKYTARLGAFSNGMVVEIEDDAEIDAMAQLGFQLIREREAERTKVVWRRITASEVLETKEYKTRYIPVIPVIGEEVNLEGKVHLRSAIYYGKDPQRMFNYWKTAATESVALAAKASWLITPEQKEGFEDQWDNANTAPAPYLTYNHVDGQPLPPRIDPPSVPIGEMAMANGASDDIKATTNMYDASLGARGNETSGKAIIARQQEGDTATFLFIDNLKKAIEYDGKVVLDLIRQVYDAERIVRILDLEGKPSTKLVNQRVYNPMTGVTEILNSLTVGKYDVVITTGPSFASQRLEMLNALQQILPALPIIGQAAPDLIVKALPFQGTEEIAERIHRALPPQITADPDSPEAQAAQAQQAQAQQAQQQFQRQAAQAQMGLEKGRIDAENAKSQAQIIKAHADVIRATQSQGGHNDFSRGTEA